MADQPVPDLPDAPNADVPRVMGVRTDNSLALTPGGLPLSGGTLTGSLAAPTTADTGSPTYSFDGHPGLGVWGAADGNMGFTTAGQERVRISDEYFTVKNKFNPVGGTTFNIVEDVNTADVLSNTGTTDERTVNEIITALLNEVRTLNARLDALEES